MNVRGVTGSNPLTEEPSCNDMGQNQKRLHMRVAWEVVTSTVSACIIRLERVR